MANTDSTRSRDFDAIAAEAAAEAGEPPTFVLNGTTFTALRDIPAWEMALYTEKENTTFMDSVQFLAGLIVPEQKETFLEAVKTPTVTIKLINDISNWLLEEISGRPSNED